MPAFRVTVRGRFADLGAEEKAILLSKMAEHDALHATYTREGTFTYDCSLSAFSFRYFRDGDSADLSRARTNASVAAELEATQYLRDRGLEFTGLRVDVIDVESPDPDVSASTRQSN